MPNYSRKNRNAILHASPQSGGLLGQYQYLNRNHHVSDSAFSARRVPSHELNAMTGDTTRKVGASRRRLRWQWQWQTK